jgi:hypothetical protein
MLKHHEDRPPGALAHRAVRPSDIERVRRELRQAEQRAARGFHAADLRHRQWALGHRDEPDQVGRPGAESSPDHPSHSSQPLRAGVPTAPDAPETSRRRADGAPAAVVSQPVRGEDARPDRDSTVGRPAARAENRRRTSDKAGS